MKSFKKTMLSVGMAVLLGVFCVFFAGCDTSNKIKLYFDGGGGSGNYTTTSSYDTLEKLAEEWNANNKQFEVVINSASLNGNRSAIVSMLQAGTAPDMLFQVGTVINDDVGNGWYADLTEYFEMPNPYEEGNAVWKDIYGEASIGASKASDGKNYYVCLDNIPVGLVYNMDILAQAGVTEVPKTYSEFLACLDALDKAREQGKIKAQTFMHGGLWQESYLGTSVYGSKIAAWDEDGNGIVSARELVKAYKAGEWSLDDEYFREFLRLCYERAKHYPDNYLAYDTSYNFARGNLAITDAIGNVMRTLTRNVSFEVEITGYPVLDKAASPMGDYTTIRGSAGLSSSYWVTNTAINKGQEAVDACVDFLMFITASKNNARMVNDLGYALPLDVRESTVDTFARLVDEYVADRADENTLAWSACYIPDSLGTDFNNYYQLAMGDFYEDSDGNKTGNIDAVVGNLQSHLDECINALVEKNKWTFEP